MVMVVRVFVLREVLDWEWIKLVEKKKDKKLDVF